MENIVTKIVCFSDYIAVKSTDLKDSDGQTLIYDVNQARNDSMREEMFITHLDNPLSVKAVYFNNGLPRKLALKVLYILKSQNFPATVLYEVDKANNSKEELFDYSTYFCEHLYGEMLKSKLNEIALTLGLNNNLISFDIIHDENFNVVDNLS